MHRQPLLKSIENYLKREPEQLEVSKELISFIKENSSCFERSNLAGHLTGSAWVIDQERKEALMMHHAKLDIWVQFGGHADGDPDILHVASKEAEEESGLSNIQLISPEIFDIDIHKIPEYKGIPEHYHYDVRFLFEADRNEKIVQNHESKELRWIPLDKVCQFTQEESVLRLVRKTNALQPSS